MTSVTEIATRHVRRTHLSVDGHGDVALFLELVLYHASHLRHRHRLRDDHLEDKLDRLKQTHPATRDVTSRRQYTERLAPLAGNAAGFTNNVLSCETSCIQGKKPPVLVFCR